MSRHCKLRHHKKVPEKIQKFISQEQYIIIFILGAHCLSFKELLK